MGYPKEIILKDGKEAVIRPLEKKDKAYLHHFFHKIPENDRWYIKQVSPRSLSTAPAEPTSPAPDSACQLNRG